MMGDAFRTEATDLLAELDGAMLELEARPGDTDLLNRVFRAIHTIKGSGATAGFIEMAAFTHHVEELFDEARMERLRITPEMIDLALEAKDVIEQMLGPAGPAGQAAAAARIVEALARFLPQPAASAPPGPAKTTGGDEARQRHTVFFKPHAQVFFSGTDPITLVDELRTLGEATVTARVADVPPLDSLDPEKCYLAWDVELRHAQPTAKIKEVFLFVEDESEIRIESRDEPARDEAGATSPLDVFLEIAGQSLTALGGFLAQRRGPGEADQGSGKTYIRTLKTFRAAALRLGQQEAVALLDEQLHLLEAALALSATLPDETQALLEAAHRKLSVLIQSLREKAPGETIAPPPGGASPPAEAAPAVQTEKAPPPAASIRVDQEKLDRLMQSAGELLVARNAFPVLAKRLAREPGLSALSKELKDAGDHISRIADDLQAAVMSIRMMPIRSVFQRFPRMVRDICRAQDKEAELLLEGEATELDKTVIEQIADPLVHLVRNAVDHGIEPPDVRAQAGKPRLGKVTLKAYGHANNVVIEVRDDGRGMDPARLKQKAVEKGLITAAVAAAMDERAALELIFLPGLTTAEKVTDISGRGVGMDVVRSNIQKLHGTTTLESWRGGGSKVTITLPASLMVSKGIMVEAGGSEYVFPIEAVAQMVRLPRGQIHRHEETSFATFRNDVFPLLRLADHFAAERLPGEVAWAGEVPMAIVQTNRGRVGVAVDRFIGQVDVIVKPMGRDFAHIAAFQGTTIMGDGRVALVINPAGLV
jgi:two-component system chemotaxis sensor kinase CheA